MDVVFDVPLATPLPLSLDPELGFCNNALTAPNETVCCDLTRGQRMPLPVQRVRSVGLSPAYPIVTGASGAAGPTGAINARCRY